MHYLRRLCCLIFGHATFTIALPLLPDGNSEEVLECCLRCRHTRALIDLPY